MWLYDEIDVSFNQIDRQLNTTSDHTAEIFVQQFQVLKFQRQRPINCYIDPLIGWQVESGVYLDVCEDTNDTSAKHVTH